MVPSPHVLSLIARLFFFAALLLACALSRAATAQSGLTDVSFAIIGHSSGEWPLYIAQQQGFFRQEGLNVSVVLGGTPPNTVNLFASGDVNIVNIGTDSCIAAIAHQIPMKLVSTMFVPMPYRLMTSPSITTWSQLKGKTIILATKKDVTAIFLRKVAAAQHLDMERDFSIVLGGTSPVRYTALVSGNVQGAVISQPYDLQAEAGGMHVLAQAAGTIKSWLFAGIGVNPSWGAAHRAEVVKFIRALRKATDYGYTHPQEAVAILQNVTHVDQTIAQKAYALDFNQWHAFSRTMQINPKDVQAVMDAVVDIGTIPAPLPVADMIDPSYAVEAAR
ncbi:MAG TPA: ABC transporter substrate-binding protein [Candidatus Binatia bacterium]|nr:ABC transporter substrate-binding protein [Candidatus Binatia bacterium]